MRDNKKREQLVVLDKPPVLEQTSVESYYLNNLVVTEATILEYLRLPRLERAESITHPPKPTIPPDCCGALPLSHSRDQGE